MTLQPIDLLKVLMTGICLQSCIFEHARPSTEETTPISDNSTIDSSFVNSSDPYHQAQVLFNDRPLPLRILGNGYYIVTKNNTTYYSKDSILEFNSMGQLQTLDGYAVMGGIADSLGNINSSSLAPIKISPHLRDLGKASQKLSLFGNLNADSQGKESIINTNTFLSKADTQSALLSLRNSRGKSLNLRPYDIINITAPNGNTTAYHVTDQATDPARLPQAPTTSAKALYNLGDVLRQINGAIIELNNEGQYTGAYQIPKGWQITTTAPLASSVLASTFAGSLNYAQTSFITDVFLCPATASDKLSTLYSMNGEAMWNANTATSGSNELQTGDRFKVSAWIDNQTVGNINSLVFEPNSTTLGDIVNFIQQELKLPTTNESAPNTLSVSVNPALSDDNIPDGSILIYGRPGSDYEISNFALKAENNDPTTTAPKIFNSNSVYTAFQHARNPGVCTTTVTLLDHSLDSHTITLQMIPSSTLHNWTWTLSTDGRSQITAGKSGKISFGLDGYVKSWSFDDGSTALKLTPNNGSQPLEIAIDLLSDRAGAALTEFQTQSQINASANGTQWSLPDTLDIDPTGNLAITYTNKTIKRHAKIRLVDFSQSRGLTKIREGLWSASPQSGPAQNIVNPLLSPISIKAKVISP